MKIEDFLRPENVILDLSAPTKPQALRSLSARASESLSIAEDRIFDALTNREQLGSTGVGAGVAIPHASVTGVSAPFGMLARLTHAIDFDAVDDAPVDVIFVLLAPNENTSKKLVALSCIARQLHSEDVLRSIRSATTAQDLYRAVTGG